MSIENLKSKINDYAKDIRLNLGSVLDTGAEGLTEAQVAHIALASAYATQNETIISEIVDEFAGKVSEEELEAAKSAAVIMAMNNVYYRTMPMIDDDEYLKMSTGLRMQILASHGIDKTDFELMSIAVSSINACKFCVKSHVKKVSSDGISKQGVQSTIKIAAVINAAAQAVVIG